MNEKLVRIGTTYIPVKNAERSSEWYVNNLGARINYKDEDKAILDLANQSIFLVKASDGQSSNFYDHCGQEHFSLTFEVNGLDALEQIHSEFLGKGMRVSKIENRGHAGKNFVFHDPDGNAFDVWSELSPAYKAFFQSEQKHKA
ncbi:VOC family protein [Metabacillus idriensis]|uniref:VOC family protein n=1 Tax=Metabacillus idriensis TaxID=324768 RepID=A0A6I2MH68_9BACI|nr:VOC family protein [Metabacillus idriensis]MCM3596764.1 VOC family protein [Metabacillus idriensis]MRX56406.1 VOC family protein [Metabacillus idriensis]OHR63634.1 glyoxalase [Bacillus sp. HMSC76G11]